MQVTHTTAQYETAVEVLYKNDSVIAFTALKIVLSENLMPIQSNVCS